MENAQIIGGRVLIMGILIVIGVIAYKTGIINKDGTKQLSSIEIKIVNPLLIFMSYQQPFSSDQFTGLLWTFLLSVVSFAVVVPLSSLIKRRGAADWTVERFSCIYSNCGFMGIPLICGLYGEEGVLCLTAYITLFNLLVYTHGYMLMKEEHDLGALKKVLVSPTVISIVVGIICYVTRLRLVNIPLAGKPLADAFNFIADLNTPLAMLIAGATTAQSDLMAALKDRRILTTTACKLLVMPAAVILVLRLFGDSVGELPRMIVCIACACPAATTGTMFALLFDKNAERCSSIFALTTVLSLVTLPLVTAAASL